MTNEMLLLGRLMGEILSLRKAQGLNIRESDATLYGLLNGFETAIDDILPETVITKQIEDAVGDALEPIFNDPIKLATFNGFYDIERDLERSGVNRIEAMLCFRKFRLNGTFTTVIDKIEAATNGGSPIEFHNLSARPSEM